MKRRPSADIPNVLAAPVKNATLEKSATKRDAARINALLDHVLVAIRLSIGILPAISALTRSVIEPRPITLSVRILQTRQAIRTTAKMAGA
jgi:hypothetical protein